jgi:hypothetical protein
VPWLGEQHLRTRACATLWPASVRSGHSPPCACAEGARPPATGRVHGRWVRAWRLSQHPKAGAPECLVSEEGLSHRGDRKRPRAAVGDPPEDRLTRCEGPRGRGNTGECEPAAGKNPRLGACGISSERCVCKMERHHTIVSRRQISRSDEKLAEERTPPRQLSPARLDRRRESGNWRGGASAALPGRGNSRRAGNSPGAAFGRACPADAWCSLRCIGRSRVRAPRIYRMALDTDDLRRAATAEPAVVEDVQACDVLR